MLEALKLLTRIILMGDGPDLNKIQDSIKGFQLEGYVTILPFNSNPFDIVQNARFTVQNESVFQCRL
jgi:hypothetical protein